MTNKNAFAGTFAQDAQAYRDFLNFYRERDQDLCAAVELITWRCREVWTDDWQCDVDLGQLHGFLVKALGEEAVRRLFQRREEAVADEAFCCRVGARLWEIADAAPRRGPEEVLEKHREAPAFAKHWEARDRDTARRQQRYARHI